MDGDDLDVEVTASWGDRAGLSLSSGCQLMVCSQSGPSPDVEHWVSLERENAVELAKAILKAYWL